MRERQIKNMLVTLFVSRGVPMLLGGDEFRRTQAGNNNAYCQDNEISWYDWRLADPYAGLRDFVRGLIAFRRAHPVLRREAFYTERDATWFGAGGEAPSWDAADNRLGCVLSDGEDTVCLLFNATRQPCRFVVPHSPVGAWKLAVDTAGSQAIATRLTYIEGEEIELSPRSVALLEPIAPAVTRL